MSEENLSAKAAKAAAAAARNAAAAVEQKRQRKIRLIGGAVVVLIMGALIAIPTLSNTDAVIPSNAALPAGVTSDTYGVKVGPAWDAPDADKIPILQIWEDFQCPACARFEAASGATLQGLIDAGKVRVEYRSTIFFGCSNRPNQRSRNPRGLAFCALSDRTWYVCGSKVSQVR